MEGRHQKLQQLFKIKQLLNCKDTYQMNSILNDLGIKQNYKSQLQQIIFSKQKMQQESLFLSKPNPWKVQTKKQDQASVDSLVPDSQFYRVHKDDQFIYNAMLNQTNIMMNNNKFYIIQVLVKKQTEEYYFWSRWGRVGVPGQSALISASSKQQAITQFKNKLKQKTQQNDYQQIVTNNSFDFSSLSKALNQEPIFIQKVEKIDKQE